MVSTALLLVYAVNICYAISFAQRPTGSGVERGVAWYL
jgi:hypothetical protein